MESSSESERNFSEELSEIGDPTNSVTMDVSLLHHEKGLLLEKTKTQESEIMALRLKVDAFEKLKLEAEKKSVAVYGKEDKTSMEREISALRGKVALLERNNKIFSNQERTELKHELERTKRRFKNLNEQLNSVRNSMEYDHINHVERALDNFVKRVKALENENYGLRKNTIGAGSEGEESRKLIEEKEEIIKDQDIMIEELQYRMKSMASQDQAAKSTVPPISLGINDVQATVESDRDSPRKLGSSRRSSMRESRPRLSPSRSGPVHKEADSNLLESTEASDSDAHAIRKMCGKMREDIEEAKQKLRDMGAALEIPQHASPTQFPLKVYNSPIFGTANVQKKVEMKAFPLITYQSEEIQEPETCPRWSGSVEKGTPRANEVDSSRDPAVRTSRPSNCYVTRVARHVPSSTSHRMKNITVPWETMSFRESLDLQSEKKNEARSTSRPGNFMHLICRYEFLLVRSLDHRLLEVEQECTREDCLKLMKMQLQRSRKNEELATKVKNIPAGTRQDYGSLVAHAPAERTHDDDIELDMSGRRQYVEQVSSDGPRSYASTYALPGNANLRSSPYRVYIVKTEYSPPDQHQSRKTIFRKIHLRVGDVATSLGAPETREGGKRYQLVEVNDKIGFVPLAHLQLAEEVHDTGRCSRVTRTYLTTTLRRIPDLYKQLNDRRRIMRCGV